MVKRKKGGFSFFDAKSSKAQKPKKVVHTRTVNAPAVRFIENKAVNQGDWYLSYAMESTIIMHRNIWNLLFCLELSD